MRILCYLLFLVVVNGMARETYDLCICAIFKNEAPYLKEWIEFHKLQGVQHFFLYNNSSNDNYLEILEPYISAKMITLEDWHFDYLPAKKGERTVPWLCIQTGAYTHCIQKYGITTNWMALIDIDEFLFCPDGTPLPKFLENYKKFGGLIVNWMLFGTSNIYDLPKNSLLIENLIRCAPKTHERNFNGKSIIQPKYALRALNAHCMEYKKGFFSVDTEKRKTPKYHEKTLRLNLDKIRINHYWTRTENFFQNTKIPSRNNRREEHDKQKMEQLRSCYNNCVNQDIMKFVPELKKILNLENSKN